jgi:hypothetical protein
MKTKAIEFGGCCALEWCGSDNNTEGQGGVEVLLDNGSLADDDMGEMICLNCAEKLARLLKKRARECRERQAQGLEYRAHKWRKKKASSEPATVAT